MARIVREIQAGGPNVASMAVAHTEQISMALITETEVPSSELPEIDGKYPWFALQVRARREGNVADYLSGNGYEWFLPLYKCRKVWSDRIKEIETPLFPGYLFCRFNPLNRLPILKAPGVIQVVGYNRMPVPVDGREIAAIQILAASGIPNQPWPFLSLGDRIRIKSGPLRGLEGILSAFKGSHRLVASVSLLQRSVAVDIDSAFVTPLKTVRAKDASFRPAVAGT